MNERKSLGYFETLIVNYDAKGKGYDDVDKELWMSYEFFKDIIKENTQLKEVILVGTKKEVALQEQITKLQKELKDKDEKISKVKQVCINYRLSCNCKDCTFDLSKEISKILESNKED